MTFHIEGCKVYSNCTPHSLPPSYLITECYLPVLFRKRSTSFCRQPVTEGQVPGCLPFLTFNASTSCTISLLCLKDPAESWEREGSSRLWKGQMRGNGTSQAKGREIEEERWKYNKRRILTTKISNTGSTSHFFFLCRFNHICYDLELQN